MLIKIALASLVLCAVIQMTKCERGYCSKCHFIPYRRIKRGKYPNPPQRFYSRPPVSFPHIGAFSYTPPPSYMVDDEPQKPGHRPFKVSKKPNDDGLGNEDINNLMKYLTKKDLDRIVEYANQKQKEDDYIKESPFDKFNNEYSRPKKTNDISIYNAQDTDDDVQSFQGYNKDNNKRQSAREEGENIFKATVQEVETDQKYFLNGPYREQNANEFNPYGNYRTDPTPMKYFDDINNNKKAYTNSALITEESMPNRQILYSNGNQVPSKSDASYILTDTKVTEEEILPKPLNLREELDFDGSFTNNVPITVKADSSSYKVESFGDLPLMNFNSKLDSVSSYHVPHYTVTTSTKYQAPSSISSQASSSSYGNIPLEPAPAVSAAKEQSDAHLKAIKIWSHRSTGTAYTLHDDGTLSLEKPSRPRGYYGYP